MYTLLLHYSTFTHIHTLISLSCTMHIPILTPILTYTLYSYTYAGVCPEGVPPEDPPGDRQAARLGGHRGLRQGTRVRVIGCMCSIVWCICYCIV